MWGGGSGPLPDVHHHVGGGSAVSSDDPPWVRAICTCSGLRPGGYMFHIISLCGHFDATMRPLALLSALPPVARPFEAVPLLVRVHLHIALSEGVRVE